MSGLKKIQRTSCFVCCSSSKMLPKTRFGKPLFGHSTGSTELDRAHRKEPCPSFPCFLEKGQENDRKNKDFLSLPNPSNPWKRRQKQKTRKSSQGKKQGIPKKQGKEGQGSSEKILGPESHSSQFWVTLGSARATFDSDLGHFHSLCVLL